MKEKIKNSKIKRIMQLLTIIVIILLLLVFCGKKDKITVIFNVDGKVYSEINNVKKGIIINEPKIPTKDGYSFDGWFLGEKEFDFNEPINKDIKLHAKWNINKYNVIINTGTGAIINEKVEFNSVVNEPKIPIKEGYIFVGWYSNDEIFDFNTKVNSDLNIEAKWTNQIYSTYKVEHYLMSKEGKYDNVPSEMETLTGKIGSVVIPSVKEYKGYSSPELQEVTITADGTATVRYYYAINKYKLIIKADNGIKSVTGDGEYFYNDKVSLNYIIKEGYSLVNISEVLNDNFYIMTDEDVVIEFFTEPNKNTKYVVKHYKMNINGKYNNNPDEIEELFGTTDTAIEPTVKNYVGFTSPKKIEDSISGDGKTVVKYYYTRNKYQLTLSKDKGISSVTGAGKYYFEEEVTIKANVKEGYTFNGWTNGQTNNEFVYKITAQNLTINANTTVNTYMITYNLNNGTATNVSTYTVEDEIRLNPAIKTGYTFTGWTGIKVVDGVIEKGTTGNLEIIANFEANKYVVTFDTNGGTINQTSKEVTYDLAYGDLEIPIKVGYTFTGWYYDGRRIESITEVKTANNHTLEASWEANKYLVTFDTNGGTINQTSKEVTYDSMYEELETPVKVGYTFTGWYLDGEKVESTTEVKKAKNHTLEAKYIANTYKIILDKNGGTGQDNVIQTAYDVNTVLPSNPYTRLGYTFIGWSIEKDNTVEYTDQANVTNISKEQDVTLYAVWEINTYTITYNLNNGTATNVSTYTVEDEIRLNPATKTGYTFTGWTGTKVVNGVIEKGTTGNLEITANFEINQYKVVFNSNGGTIVDSIDVNYSDLVIRPNDPTKIGYTFDGWYLDDAYFDFSNSMPANDITLIAKWNINSTTIGFDTNGGSPIDAITQEFGSVVIAPQDPVKVGYTFDGWYIDDNLTHVYNFTTMPAEGIIVYAKWLANSYVVTFDTNGGTISQTNKEVTYDLTYGNLEIPIKEGYTFTGWYYDGRRIESTTEVKIANNHTLEASWEANKYLVTFDTNGGTINQTSKEVTYDSTYGELETPVKEGYTFTGWYLDGVKVESTTIVKTANNHTLEASWEANKYLVTFDTNGGIINQTSKEVTYDSTYGKLEVPVKEGYTFTGWYLDGVKVESTTIVKTSSSHTLKANFISNEYLVTFDTNGGTINQTSKEVTYDSTYGKLEVPVKEGYTFTGWYYDGKKVESTTVVKTASSHTLEASWEANKYLVTFDTNGGTINQTSKEVTYDLTYGDLEVPVKVGYTFTGWYYDGRKIESTTVVKTASSHTLEAGWEANKYLVTFDTNGGTINQTSKEVTYDLTYGELETPVKVGYTFTGWYLDGVKVESTTIVKTDSSHTLEAKYIANTYKIILDKNSGTGQDNVIQTAYDVNTVLPSNPYTRLGYTFIGWSVEKDNTVEYTDQANVTNISKEQDVTLYAVWEINIYTITYNLNNGTATNVSTYTVEDEIRLNPATKTGYTFTGWTGTKVVDGVIEKGTIGNLEITANFEANKYVVTFDTNGGTINQTSKEVTYDSMYGGLETPVKEGYTFTGWYLDGKKVESTTVVKTASSHTLEAGWEANKYLVTFDTNGGTINQTSKEVTYDLTYGDLEVPVKVGYTFTGWYYDGRKIESTTVVKTASSHTLEAGWEANEYLVTFDTNGGTINQTSKEVTYDSTYGKLEVPVKEGYTFTGWYLDGVKVESTTIVKTSSSHTLKANFISNEYLVTFDTNGGIINQISKEVTYDLAYGDLEIPIKEGYTFTGWYYDGKKVESTTVVKTASSHTLEASWEANKYLVTFNANGGTINQTSKEVTYDLTYGDLETPVKVGYTFTGWYLDGEKVEATTIVKTASSHTLEAKYIANTYKIILDKNNGIGQDTVIQTAYDINTILPGNPYTKLGYIFVGWSLEKDNTVEYTDQANVTNISEGQDVTLYAVWANKPYTIVYNANGGTGTMSSTNAIYNTEVQLNPNNYLKTGYSFIGWSTSSDASVEFTNNQKVINLTAEDQITLYAVWTLETYTITYNLDNGNIVGANPTTYTYESEDIVLIEPTRDDYVFAGWSINGNTNNDGIIENGTAGNLNVTALWRIKPLIESVSFDLFKADENGSYDSYYADGQNHSIYMGDKTFYLKLPRDSSLDIYTLSIKLNTEVVLNGNSVDIEDNYADITAADDFSLNSYSGTINLNLDIPLLPTSMKLKSTDKGVTWKSTNSGGMKVSVIEFTSLLSKNNKRLALAQGLGITNDKYALETPRYLSRFETIGGNVFMFFGAANKSNALSTKSVTFINASNEHTVLSPIVVPVGSQIPDIGEVKVAGYKWLGWYMDKELTIPLDFSQFVYENITIYGKYDKIPVEESWYYDSLGTEEDPYKLCGASQVVAFATFVENDPNYFANKYVELTCDTYLNDTNGNPLEWNPIDRFSGTFNGNGYTIYNLTVNDTSGTYKHIGFFDTLHKATVKNLKFKNVNIYSTQSTESGVLAAVLSNSIVEKVAIDGISITGGDYIGGLIGQSADITNKTTESIIREISVTNGTVTAQNFDVGGILGAAAHMTRIYDVYSDVSVTSKGTGLKPADAGGILGNYYGKDENFTMERVIFTGSVKVDAEKIMMFLKNSSGAIYGRIGTGSSSLSGFDDSFMTPAEKATLLYKKSGIGLSQSHSLARGVGMSESDLKNKAKYDTNVWSNWTFSEDGISYPILTWLVSN